MKKSSLVSLLLLVSLLVTALVPLGNVSAGTDVVKGALPSVVSPTGLIVDRTPTYLWYKFTGATQYHLQVVQYATLVVNLKYYTSSTLCGATYCSVTPSVTLGFKPYKWRIGALVGSVWTWSAYKEFTITSPSFYSGFNGNKTGWAIVNNKGGAWSLNPSYVYTNGMLGTWSSLYRYANDGKYNDLIYTARIKRTGGNTATKSPANCLMVRMGAYTTAGSYQWWPGYRFCINNYGKYEVWYQDVTNGTYSIQAWTASPAIVKYGWNTLRVLAVGSSFEFYINGVMVKNFTDTSKNRGYVGLSMVRFDNTFSTQFQADYAQVNVQGLSADAIKSAGPQAVLVPVSAEEVMGSD